MWYVVQVKTGTEESVRIQYEKQLLAHVREDKEERRCFIPRYEEMRRYHGEWHREQKILFPGYVFVAANDTARLFGDLKQVIGLTKLLRAEGAAIPLTKEEERFLSEVGGARQVVPVSKGFMENERVTVTEGPLVGREGLIKRIDRHKRKAWLEMELFGKKQRVEMGLEIVEKRQTEGDTNGTK